MPTNLYGPGDNYDLNSSHVLAALIHRFTLAVRNKSESVTLWGSGKPRGEFLHSDDLASAVATLIEKYDSPDPVNVGVGSEVSIAELALKIAKIAGFKGLIEWDSSKPDGTPRKLLDVSKLQNMGWSATISLDEGLERACAVFAALSSSK